MPAIDVLAMTSHRFGETFPLSVLEGMACGVPVCATDVGCVRDMLGHETEGFVSPPGDPTAMAVNIGRLVADSSLRERMSVAARLRAEREFGIERRLHAVIIQE